MNKRQPGGFLILLSLLALVLAACGGGTSTPSPGSSEVRVTLTDSTIVSSQTTLSPGVSYHFIVTNEGKAVQEWMIIPMAAAPSEMHANALAMIDSVPASATKTVDYTFPASTVGQTLEFACYLHGQYEVGMQLPITVTR
jgi:uncharacterized cupredoxin-like copper-binding protein